MGRLDNLGLNMRTFIERGTRFLTEVGTDEKPDVVRWTNWGYGTLQQSFALMTTEGVVLIDPGRPVGSGVDALDEIIGDTVAAVVCTTALHERNIYWFRERYGARIYVPKAGLHEFLEVPDHVFADGDALPGSVKAVRTLGAMGETVLHWTSPGETNMLLCGDAIYGQSIPGAFDSTEEQLWMQVGGVRLMLGGVVDEDEMKQRYEPLLALDFDLILNGHNPRAIDCDPKGALEKVLSEGVYEGYGNGACSYLWVDLTPVKDRERRES